MRKEVKEKLDKELNQNHLRNLKVVLTVAFIFSFFVVIGYATINGDKKIIIGTVVTLHATIHEEGHDLKVMLKVPDKTNLVRVTIPKSSFIQIGDKVELIETKILWFNTFRYRFFKYIG